MNDTYYHGFVSKVLVPLLTAGLMGLFSWVWKTTAEIAIWKTQSENTEQRIKKLEEGIKDRYTRTQADRKHKEQEDRHQVITDKDHSELHKEVGRLDRQIDDTYARLDDRLRDLEKQAPELLNNDLRDFRKQIGEHERNKDLHLP